MMPFSLDSARRRFLFKDDFLGDQLQDLWRDTGDVGGSAVVTDAETGGIVRITTDGDNGDDWHIDWNDIRSLHVDQKVCLEARLKLNSLTAVAFNVALFFNNNNRVFAVYNSSGSANWRFSSFDDGASTANQDSGIAATTNYVIIRIEATATSVLLYVDDVLGVTITTNIPNDAGDFLQPYAFISTLENVAKTVDIDYIVVSQERV